jgi:hypothetical protein
MVGTAGFFLTKACRAGHENYIFLINNHVLTDTTEIENPPDL